MKRKFFQAMIAAICLAACTNSKVKTQITVVGDLGDPKPTVLCAFYTGDSIQQAQTIADTVVTFVIETTEPAFVVIDRSSGKGGNSVCSVIADGTPVVVTIQDGKGEITQGSEQNMALAKERQHINEFNDKINALGEEYQEGLKQYNGDLPDSILDKLNQSYEAITQQLQEAEKNAILNNANNLVPVYLLCRFAEEVGIEFIDSFLPTYKYRDCDALYPVNQIIAGERNKKPGAPVVDFVGKDLSGKECHLTDYVGKGKYVLVDFWASWCGPCRAEIPNVKTCYEKYREKGFEVVGISFDDNQEDWEKCVQELGITWPQISDLKGWDCAASTTYHVRGIPATILYGPDGKVIKTELRGEELGKTLSEYLDK
jgi:thiol-disulfide isomerase/thioredoxin